MPLVASTPFKFLLDSLNLIEEMIHTRDVAPIQFVIPFNAKADKEANQLRDFSVSGRDLFHGLRTITGDPAKSACTIRAPSPKSTFLHDQLVETLPSLRLFGASAELFQAQRPWSLLQRSGAPMDLDGRIMQEEPGADHLDAT